MIKLQVLKSSLDNKLFKTPSILLKALRVQLNYSKLHAKLNRKLLNTTFTTFPLKYIMQAMN